MPSGAVFTVTVSAIVERASVSEPVWIAAWGIGLIGTAMLAKSVGDRLALRGQDGPVNQVQMAVMTSLPPTADTMVRASVEP